MNALFAMLSVFAVVFVGFFSSMDTVSTGYRGVVYVFGKAERILDEGIYFTNPFTTDVEKFEIRTKKVDAEGESASKDLQSVSAKLAINYSVQPEKILELIRKVGKDFEMRVLAPSIIESMKASTAKFTAEELVTKREQVREEIVRRLSERMAEYGVKIDGVNITNFDFSASFNQSIEAKVKAEQDALTSKNQLARIEYEGQQRVVAAKADKEASIAKAQGEAESIRIQTEAIMSQGGESYVKLKWIDRWDGKLPTTALGDSSNTLVTLK